MKLQTIDQLRAIHSNLTEIPFTGAADDDTGVTFMDAHGQHFVYWHHRQQPEQLYFGGHLTGIPGQPDIGYPMQPPAAREHCHEADVVCYLTALAVWQVTGPGEPYFVVCDPMGSELGDRHPQRQDAIAEFSQLQQEGISEVSDLQLYSQSLANYLVAPESYREPVSHPGHRPPILCNLPRPKGAGLYPSSSDK